MPLSTITKYHFCFNSASLRTPRATPQCTTLPAADHAAGFQSDLNAPYHHRPFEDINTSMTDYVNADLLDAGNPMQPELELSKLHKGLQPVENDAMTIETRRTLPVEWTSPDSSYGAAFPCCGFIPKKTRRVIELCLLGLASFLFIYILIKFSVIITSGLHKNGQNPTNATGGSKYLETDDDFYVTNEANYDDHYFNYCH